MYPYLGEIQLHARDFITPGFLACDGRLLNIAEHRLLFEKLGNRFGGDGTSTFALPDLRGRAIVHHSTALPFGQAGGRATLEPGTAPTLSGAAVAQTGGGNLPVAAAGASNYQPSLGLIYMIAVEGFFPRSGR